MEWVHCNSCYLLPSNSRNKQFSLTSCGHIFCETCIQKPGFVNKCIVCGNKFTTTALNSELRSDIREYFKSPDDIIKHGLQVLMFQSGHRSRVNTYYTTLIAKYNSAKQELMRKNELLKKKEKECMEYKERLEKKSREYRDLKQLFILYKQKVHKTEEKETSASIKNSNEKPQDGSPTFLPTPKQNNSIFGSSVSLNIPRSRITLSQSSNYSVSQSTPTVTPKRLTMSKLSFSHSSNAASSILSRGSIMSASTPPSPQSTINYSTQYRVNSQYQSQPSISPSTPRTLPTTPESANESPIGRHNLESPVSISKFTPPSSGPSPISLGLFNNLNLAFKQSRRNN